MFNFIDLRVGQTVGIEEFVMIRTQEQHIILLICPSFRRWNNVTNLYIPIEVAYLARLV